MAALYPLIERHVADWRKVPILVRLPGIGVGNLLFVAKCSRLTSFKIEFWSHSCLTVFAK